MNEHTFSAVLSCRVPQCLKQRIAEFRQRNRLGTETRAIVELLEVALYVDDVRQQLNDPQIVEFLRARLYDQQLIDWIYDLPNDRLDALFGAFSTARDLRFQKKLRG